MLNHVCIRLKQLLDSEKSVLKKEIDKNKYYLSKREHHEVGWKEAEIDFIEHYLNTWASGFKAAYCNYVCDVRDNCDLRNK